MTDIELAATSDGAESTSGGTQLLGVGGAALATIAWGASGVIAKALKMDALAVVSYRFSMAGLVFLAVISIAGDRLTLAKFRVAFPAGAVLAVDTALFFSAVKETTVANATVIGALQPVLMLVLARRLLGEKILAAQVFWSLVAVGGVAFLVLGSSGLPGWSLRGDLLAVAALLAWTLYLYLVKVTQTDGELTTLEFSAAVAIITAVLTIPTTLIFGQDLSWPTGRSWLLLALMAFGSGLFAHPVMNWALARIPVSIGSAMTLLVPISASLMAWLFLDERITGVQVIGVGVTLLSLAALTRIHVTTGDEIASDREDLPV